MSIATPAPPKTIPSPLPKGTTDREAFNSLGATNSWRAWEAIGQGRGVRSLAFHSQLSTPQPSTTLKPLAKNFPMLFNTHMAAGESTLPTPWTFRPDIGPSNIKANRFVNHIVRRGTFPKIMASESDTKHIIHRLRELEAENTRLRDENAVLRSKVTFFDEVTWLASGLRGENVIAELLGGEVTRHNARHDLTLRGKNNITMEIKLSNHSRLGKNRPTRTWAWARLLGADGGKQYDRLILLGDADPRYQTLYADPTSPYVLFDIPFADVPSLVDKFGLVHLTTNPQTVRTSTAERLYNRYQVTLQHLRKQYRSA